MGGYPPLRDSTSWYKRKKSRKLNLVPERMVVAERRCGGYVRFSYLSITLLGEFLSVNSPKV